MSRSGQVLHFGDVPVQICLPNGTNNELIAIQ
jgi:hypothetical protein